MNRVTCFLRSFSRAAPSARHSWPAPIRRPHLTGGILADNFRPAIPVGLFNRNRRGDAHPARPVLDVFRTLAAAAKFRDLGPHIFIY